MKKGFVIAGCAMAIFGAIGYYLYRKHGKKTYVNMPPRKDDEELEDASKDVELTWASYKGEDAPEEEEEENDNFVPNEHPYRITEDEYKMDSLYEKESLTFFADGVLADDTNQLIESPFELVGDVRDYFDEGVDVVHMRNEFLGFDYEIVSDPRTYMDIVKKNPYLVGGKFDDEVDEE